MRINKIGVAVLFSILGYGAAANGEEPNPLKLLGDCREACKKISDYTGTFTKREFLDGKLRDAEVLFIKFRQEPLSIYAKWIGEAHKGREAIYVQGKNDDMVIGHELIGPLNIAKNVKVDSSEARKQTRQPLTEAGMLNLVRTFIRFVEMGKQNNDMRLSYVGTETFDGRPVHLIVRILEKREDYPAYITFIYVDKERLLPLKSVGYDWDYKMLWVYTNVDLKLDVGLTDEDFDPKNKEYNYPTLISFEMPKLF